MKKRTRRKGGAGPVARHLGNLPRDPASLMDVARKLHHDVMSLGKHFLGNVKRFRNNRPRHSFRVKLEQRARVMERLKDMARSLSQKNQAKANELSVKIMALENEFTTQAERI